MAKNLPIYPKRELERVCWRFMSNWREAVNNKDGDYDGVRLVDSLHREHPPDIDMLNTNAYPFLEDDAFNPPMHLLISQGRSEDSSKTTNSTTLGQQKSCKNAESNEHTKEEKSGKTHRRRCRRRKRQLATEEEVIVNMLDSSRIQ